MALGLHTTIWLGLAMAAVGTCTGRRVVDLAERMGEALDQDAVFLLAFPSDSLLVLLPAPKGGQT